MQFTFDKPRAEVNTQDAAYKDLFPDHVVRRNQEQDADGGAVDDEGDNAKVPDVQDGDDNITTGAEAKVQRPKRGRPKRTVHTASKAGNEGPTPQRRKSGRLNNPGVGSSEAAAAPDRQQKQTSNPASEAPKNSKQARKEQGTLNLQVVTENLRKRRSGEFPGEEEPNQPEHKQATPSGVNGTTQDPKDGPYVPAEDEHDSDGAISDENEDEDGEDEAENKNPSQGKTLKRRAQNRLSTAKTGRKRQRVDGGEDDAVGEVMSSDRAARQRRLYGQWLAFQKVVKNLDLVGCSRRDDVIQPQINLELRDKDVKAVVDLCENAKERFSKLKDHSGGVEAEHGPAGVLNEIAERVDGLRGFKGEFPTNFENKKTSQSIYFHLIPELVKLVEHLVLCYEEMDNDDAPRDQITFGHLRIVNELIELIIELEATAESRYVRPNTNLTIVKPIHQGVALPLHAIHRAFEKCIYDHDTRITEERRREDAAKDRAIRLEQEERRSRQQTRIHRLKTKWEKLHEERMWAEGGFIRPRKREHLQLPAPENYFEVDQDGLHFERTEVFHPRVGPPPGLVDEATAKQWSLVELSTLCDGLKQYAGKMVFERIFRKFCGQGRELNRYNVTDIVTTAAGLREMLTKQQKDSYGDVEDWISSIPVWTKAHQALGKENEDSVVDLTAEN